MLLPRSTQTMSFEDENKTVHLRAAGGVRSFKIPLSFVYDFGFLFKKTEKPQFSWLAGLIND